MKKVRINQDLCIGCGMCASLCSAVFRMDDSINKAEVYNDVSKENEEYVKLAIDSCPVSAISWEE